MAYGRILGSTADRFNKEIFFLLLLPPIIFEAGYNMKRLHFFKNIGPIIVYAFAGTLISTVVIAFLCFSVGQGGWGFPYSVSLKLHGRFAALTEVHVWLVLPAQPVESLIFGALISATDPVTVLAIFSDMKADLNLCAPRPDRLFRFGVSSVPKRSHTPLDAVRWHGRVDEWQTRWCSASLC
jgi:sodium/hydrogen exchanger-like protein 6/7